MIRQRLLRGAVHEAVVLGAAFDQVAAVDVREEVLQLHRAHPRLDGRR